MDPIKPKQSLVKKPNFKKEELEHTIYGSFFNPQHIDVYQDYFLSSREPPRGERRVFNVNVGEINDIDIEYFTRRLQESLRVPPRYLGNQETEVVGIEQMRTQQEVENLYINYWCEKKNE